ncbi:MAG: hypothetical protein EOS70_28055 [Mesorhizobium sp.]|uniref:hypothetical protein n=1 Tax=Mesorhizobium sp. TaxID=1871066 RepID=UPI000FE9BC59|nr:hypothetical protein [Mesorhizobium sp.]RWC28167.1 MAG: hypothetical protein EOS70_28055 [Mesorhizobium sp.]
MPSAIYENGEDGVEADPTPASGLRGHHGWSMVTALVADGERRVRQLVDWTGGEGIKPDIGGYLGPLGLVDDIADATDDRGAKGDKGDDGDQGVPGADGADGASAYQVAVNNGFVGTEPEWLDFYVNETAQAATAAAISARDLSEAWAESDTAPDPADPASQSSKTWAGESQTSAGASSASAAAAALDAAAAEAAIGGVIYATEAAGRAAVADGAPFLVQGSVPEAWVDLHRRIDAATVTATLRSYPSLAAILTLYVPSSGIPKVKRYISMITATLVTQTGPDTWTRSSGTATWIGQFKLSAADIVERDAGRPITVRFPVTGAFSDVPDYQQFTSASVAIGSRVDMTYDAVNAEYYVTFVMDPTADIIRLRWSATAAATCAAPYVLYQGQVLISDLTTVGGRKRVDDWALEVAETSGDIFGGTHWTAGIGTLGEISLDQRTLSVPIGSRSDKALYVLGLLAPTDGYTLILELLEASTFNVSAISVTPDTGLGGGGGTAGRLVARHGNLLFYQGSAAAAAGAYARYMNLTIDNRNPGIASFVAGNLKVRVHALLKGYYNSYKLTDMAALKRAMSAKANRTGYVSTIVPVDSSDVYTSVPAAVAAGHRVVKLTGSAAYRLPVGLAIPRPLELDWHPTGQPAGTTLTRPRLYASSSIAAGDWVATAADPNVYYRVSAATPVGMWEVTTSTGVITRMGIPTTDVLTGKVRISTSEAEVRANIGAYWWGVGTEGTGIYIRPFGDTLVGKTWEAPTGLSCIYAINTQVRLSNIVLNYSTGNSLYVRGGEIHTNNIEVGRCGVNGAQFEEGARWYDVGNPSLAFDAGNDGWGANSFIENPVHWTLGRTRAEDNQYDGFAPHGTFIYVRSVGMFRAKNNGKQGFVSITPGYYDFDIEATGNRSVDVLIQLGAGVAASEVYGRHWIAGRQGIQISHNTPSLVTGRIERMTFRDGGGFIRTGNIDVGFLEGSGDDMAGGIVANNPVLYRAESGTGTVFGGRGTRYVTLFDLNSPSTTKLRGGNWTRSTNGIDQAVGATLDLDANNPINLFGNTTQFTGVGAPDQAKVISVQAAY